MRGLLARAGLVVLLALGAGCGGGDGEEVVVRAGTAPPATVEITVPPAEPGNLSSDRAWPDACDLLTEADVRAVLPDITQLTQESGDLDITVLGGSDRTIPAAWCAYIYYFAGTETGELLDYNRMQLTFTVDLAGDPEVVAYNYENMVFEDNLIDAGPLGADQCAHEGRSYVCRTDDVVFTVAQDWVPGGFRFQNQGDQEITEYFQDHVMPEVVRAVTAKL